MKTFRPGFQQTLIRRLAHLRRPGGHGEESCYEVLSPPHRNSPFLTLAEHNDPQRRDLALWVLKILVVLEEDGAAHAAWSEVLDDERQRWQDELRERLHRPSRVDRLQLPLAAPPESAHELVHLDVLGPLRRAELLNEHTGGQDPRFRLLARPFIPWPRLRDVGYSIQQMRGRWQRYCDDNGLSEQVRDHEGLFRHFCDEALIPGPSDLLLTSAWRLRKLAS